MHWLVQLQKDVNYKLIGHTGCCYDCMTKDTIIMSNILDAQRRFGNLKFNWTVILLLCISNRQYKDN